MTRFDSGFRVEFFEGDLMSHTWEGRGVDELDALLQARRDLEDRTTHPQRQWCLPGTRRSIRITQLLG